MVVEILINKLGAADRLLNSSIRLFFLEEDQLAIHVVASASYNVLSDLLRHSGKEEAFWPQAYGILRAIKDITEGKLSERQVRSDWPQGSWESFAPLVERYKRDPFDIDTCQVSGPSSEASSFWKEFRKSYNFLKHADRDQHSFLNEEAIDNIDLLTRALAAAAHLNCPTSSEKTFFFAYLMSMERLPIDTRVHEASALAAIFKELKTEEVFTLARRNLCYPVLESKDVDIDLPEDPSERARSNLT